MDTPSSAPVPPSPLPDGVAAGTTAGEGMPPVQGVVPAPVEPAAVDLAAMLAPLPASDPDLSIERFMRELWAVAPQEQLVEFFFLQDVANRPKPKTNWIFYPISQVLEFYPPIETNLLNLNHKGWNIHHSLNPRYRMPKKRGKNADVNLYTCLWADMDWHRHNVTEDSIRAKARALLGEFLRAGIPPSAILDSGFGLHFYWLLLQAAPTDPVTETSPAREACAGLQDFCKISDAINDPSRVLRWPGTVNWRYRLKGNPDPPKCRITWASWQRYPLEVFEAYRVKPGKTKERQEDEAGERKLRADLERITKGVPVRPSRDPKIEELKTQGVDEGGGPFGGRHNAAKALAGHYAAQRRISKSAVAQAMREWNRALCRPPIDDEQVDGLVDYAWNREQLKRAEEAREREEHPPPERRPPPDDHGPAEIYFRGKEFLPELLAEDICSKHAIVATPEGDDGLGVSIYRYRDGAFRRGGESFIIDEVRAALGPDHKEGRASEVKKNIRMSRRRDYADVNKDASRLLNVRNGMLDWKTGELHSHDAKHLSTIQINADYDPAARSAELDQFMAAILPADDALTVEEFIGYLMIPDASFGKCLVAVGEGGNGKSTFLRLLTAFLGAENVSNYSLHNISDERFSAAGLFGKLANFYDELPTKTLKDTATFKLIVGGDAIKAEEKNKAPFSFRPFCRLVFATNQMPRANDRSEAYFDRFIFVRFPNRIRGTAGVVREYEKILIGFPGLMSALLNKAVAGLRRLSTQNRFSPSASSAEAIEEYRKECNSVYDFVQENCSFSDPTGWISKRELYERYKGWCSDYGRRPMSSRELAKALQGMQIREVRHGDGRGFGGLNWQNGTPPTTNKSDVAGFVRSVDDDEQTREF